MCVCMLSCSVCLTLCDPLDCSLPGSSVLGILQARILERVAIYSSRGSSWPKDWTCISCIAGGFFIIEPLGKPFAAIIIPKSHIIKVYFLFIMSNIDWQGSSVHPKPLENSNQQKPQHWVRKGCDQNTHWSLQLKMSPITSLFITQEMAHMVAPNFLEMESTNLLCPWNMEEISLVSQNNSITGRNDPFLGRFDSLPPPPPGWQFIFLKKSSYLIFFLDHHFP